MASDRSEYLRKIPSVDELMGSRRFDDLVSKYSRSIVVDSVRKSLQELRAEILESDEAGLTGISLSDARIADRVSCIAEGLEKMNLRRDQCDGDHTAHGSRQGRAIGAGPWRD